MHRLASLFFATWFGRLALGGLLFIHFIFVGLGAAKWPAPFLPPFNRVLALYQGFSGAHYSWGFFAPNIGSQFKTEFLIAQKDGTQLRQTLGARGPSERLLREMGLAATFWFALRDEKIRRSLAASWAAAMFARYPDAQHIEVQVSAFFLPSMRQIRAGMASQWVRVYTAGFDHKRAQVQPSAF